MRFTFLICCVMIFFSLKVAAQSKPTFPGSVKGILRDTTRNYVLKSATVSVYKASDNTLLNYQVSNNYGEFTFKNLPTALALKIEISNVGYQTFNQEFTIPPSTNFLDLKTLVIKPKDINLKEVVITIPPISMNGDTLEFNAAAFKLDSNAVVEDLLRKIPNITLWGDGQITVNGKEVKSVLVNGKSFFGGDPKIATQNIAKNALDKIQVYNVKQNDNTDKPQDSLLQMNLKLKKGKDIGYFGKIGGGYGTDKRFEGDLSLNIFSPKMQLAIIATGNNINKTVNSIQGLIANSTFKGVGTSTDYQSDFRTSGINRTNNGGVDFTYNFIEKPTYNNKKELRASYFAQNRNYDNVTKTESTSLVSSNNQIVDRRENNNSTTSTNQTFKTDYNKVSQFQSLMISQTTNFNSGVANTNTVRSSENNQNILTSTNNAVDKSDYTNKRFALTANYNLQRNYLKPKSKFNGIRVNYKLNIYDDDNDRSNITEFKSFVNAASSRNFNRRYQTSTNSVNHAIDVELDRVKTYLFGKAKLAGIDFGINNILLLNNNDDANQVEDFKNLTGRYEKNVYLSNQIQTSLIDETPGISFYKSFSKSLSNRYYKNFNINIGLKQKFAQQEFTSEKSFQNITRSYSRFVPTASLGYSDSQSGDFYRSYTLNFNTNVRLPTINQFAPLVDSTEVYTLRRGNINLKEAIDRVITFYFNHSDQSTKNTLNYNLNITGGFIDNAISDSLLIDQQNRQTIYPINANGNKYIRFNGSVRKAYKLKTAELNFALSAGANISKTPGYINGIFSFANNQNLNSTLTVNYNFKSLFGIEFMQVASNYKSKQLSFTNASYAGTNLSSMLSGIYNVNKKFSVNSNITFTTSKAQSAKDVNFTIWNASATYRFLEGNNAEFKFSALDLLKQNNSVINYAQGNGFVVGTQNVLQQYFMTTFSYYPRKFGKNAVKK